jgi:phosphoribosyl-dephospho-CoA transferase
MYRRHELVWLTPEGWESALAGVIGEPREIVLRWRMRGLPAVVRRTEPGTPSGLLCLGIPAPPDRRSGQKLRLGFAVEHRHVAEVRSALALDAAAASAPRGWQLGLSRLGTALRAAGIECRVFGSLAMEILTGECYLGATSDVDLLLRPRDGAQLDAGLALVAHHAHSLPLDGEIEFPSGHAVSWKEWLGVDGQAWRGADRVLVKHLDAVALLRRDELLGQFSVDDCAHEDGHG